MKQATDSFADVLTRYNKEKLEYEQLSTYILMQCQKYKQRHPKSVRVVFSRQPPVKEWESIVNKILLKREKDPTYGYGRLEDLIGVTVLCAFESDAQAFINWMRKAFNVLTLPEAALVDKVDTGHRALHFIVKAHPGAFTSNPEWIRKKCEIQVKTLLEEAFDAKSHDLAYKSGPRFVSDDLKKQFVNFSKVLRAVDQQSEFLKSLILSEEKKIALRREACVSLYLSNKQDVLYGDKHGLDPTNEKPTPLELNVALTKIQELGDSEPNIRLCRLTAYYALKYDDEIFAQQAILLCEELLLDPEASANDYMAVAVIEWALESFEVAIVHVKKAIDLAVAAGSPTESIYAKSTYVYLFTDWWVTQQGQNDEWATLVYTYVQELAHHSHESVQDTLGFYKIVFGRTSDEVEEGRAMLRHVYKKAPEERRPFYVYHDYVALRRLMDAL